MSEPGSLRNPCCRRYDTQKPASCYAVEIISKRMSHKNDTFSCQLSGKFGQLRGVFPDRCGTKKCIVWVPILNVVIALGT